MTKVVEVGENLYNLSLVRKIRVLSYEDNKPIKIELHYNIWTGATNNNTGSPITDWIDGLENCQKVIKAFKGR